MFPIYSARKLVRVIEEKHGHTKPWVILAEGKDGLIPFVVKIFREDHLAQKPRVHGEFLGSWMAGEFDLMTPEVAWIKFDELFKYSLSPEQQIQIDLDDNRLKFGSRVLSHFLHFDAGLPKAMFQKHIPIDRLFAFDGFIRNSDRGAHKPNLLLSNKQAYLIDHEYALEIKEVTINELIDQNWPGSLSSSHICFPYLKEMTHKEKAVLFEDLGEYLRAVNLSGLKQVLSLVEAEGYSADVQLIMEYFRFIKSNPTTFIHLMKGVIS